MAKIFDKMKDLMFGEYEDDAVFVRNDAHKTDYEILYDPRNYSDVMGITSGQSED